MTSSLSFRISVALVAILILAAGFWLLKHSDNGHPVNIKCILWKAGIYKMGVNIAAFAMMRGNGRENTSSATWAVSSSTWKS